MYCTKTIDTGDRNVPLSPPRGAARHLYRIITIKRFFRLIFSCVSMMMHETLIYVWVATLLTLTLTGLLEWGTHFLWAVQITCSGLVIILINSVGLGLSAQTELVRIQTYLLPQQLPHGISELRRAYCAVSVGVELRTDVRGRTLNRADEPEPLAPKQPAHLSERIL